MPEHLEHRVLYVHMQALLEAYGDRDAIAGRLTPAQVLHRVLLREQQFWRRAFARHGIDDTDRIMTAAEQAAAALILCGAVDDRDAAARLFESAITVGLDPSHHRGVLDGFADLYGRTEGRDDCPIFPIEPDLLGETLLARVLGRASRDPDALDHWLDLPFDSVSPGPAMGRALTVLTRLASRSIGQAWIGRFLERHGPTLVERVDATANNGRAEPPGSVLEQAIGYLNDKTSTPPARGTAQDSSYAPRFRTLAAA